MPNHIDDPEENLHDWSRNLFSYVILTMIVSGILCAIWLVLILSEGHSNLANCIAWTAVGTAITAVVFCQFWLLIRFVLHHNYGDSLLR